MIEQSTQEDQTVEEIVLAMDDININNNDNTCKSELASVNECPSDTQSAASDTANSATQSKSGAKQKKKYQKKKMFKKKRITSGSSESSKLTTSTNSETGPEVIVENKSSHDVVNKTVSEIVETKGKPKSGKKYFRKLHLPYNGRIINGVVYATDNHNISLPKQNPKGFRKNINHFSGPNGMSPLSYETPFRIRNNHSYSNNYRNNYPLSVAYMPQQKYFRPFNNYQHSGEYYYGPNPFPKLNKKSEPVNNNKVTENVESEQLPSTKIVDENVNTSSTSVNTLVATN